MYYFYCPNCKAEDEVKSPPLGAVGNCRDGWGVPIHHYKCPKCGNLDAGCMYERTGDTDEKEYYKGVISYYQGIRGFKAKN